jgi:hypothetical protein
LGVDCWETYQEIVDRTPRKRIGNVVPACYMDTLQPDLVLGLQSIDMFENSVGFAAAGSAFVHYCNYARIV